MAPNIIIIIKSTQGRVVAPLRDLVISLDLPVLQLRELINWQVPPWLLMSGWWLQPDLA
jgi:hypothetical protein